MNNRQRNKRYSREIKKSYRAYKESWKDFPAWYWKYGLHDAEILEVSELGDGIDKKRGKYYKNCLVLTFDSSGAIYETDIKKIIFYNYEVKMSNAPLSQLSKTWWMGDTIERLSNGNYLLNFEVSLENNDRLNFFMEFEYVQVER